ncbi:8-hydroxyquercetin 8-O-methyltransferase-like [Salvia splendens]|uniref:8-hydroxyquercetin 8-O-methyltransferase-like n=1 Tax=Salvia splendens TaxID=180675 RepID=UPI001103FE44|nr:8-hydroxyquercetin 8-O-methyltransferase-like [Salvia splendens]XP_042066727.1 8-hydroxyquercetin 8-O-methyltransferase-like [Salvia splendens]
MKKVLSTPSTKMAFLNGLESTQDLLDAQAHVWSHTFNYINSMSLKCAVQLGIPDAIHKHGAPMTLSQLADALSINNTKSNGLFRLMRILVHSKFFDKVKALSEDEDKEEEEAYCLTLASRFLVKDEPLSMATFVVAMIDPTFVDPFHHVSEWFGDDNPSPFFTKNGRNVWEYARVEQSFNQLFNEAMATDARLVTSILVQECKQVFEGLEMMVDVGGGTGIVARGVGAAFPGLKCVVLDLPHVVAGLEGSDKLSFVGGDMFQFIPNADAVFLKWILHDWNDEECVRILKKCKEAIAGSKKNGKKVIIVDIIVGDKGEDDKTTESKLLFDGMMMAEVTGKERSEKEWANLFYTSGFQKYNITPLGLRSVIEVFP